MLPKKGGGGLLLTIVAGVVCPETRTEAKREELDKQIVTSARGGQVSGIEQSVGKW